MSVTSDPSSARPRLSRLLRAARGRRLRGVAAVGLELLNARWTGRRCTSVGGLVRVQGKLHIDNLGEIHIGDGALLESTVVPIALIAHPGAVLSIGPRCYLNFGVCIEARARVTIGAGCQLGQYVHIMDNDQHDVLDHHDRPGSRPVVLEDGVWVGARAVILRGVHIGRGTTVGAGSVVTRSLPARCVAAGVPARVIRHLDEEGDARHPSG